MQGEAAAPDHDLLCWHLHQVGVSPHKLTAQSPDFLVISPPKTGSTWLADNLRCHPQLFVPACKEVKYFSCFFRWLDVNWYLDHFQPGAGRVKGEASPSYAILPLERIRLVRRLFPNVKLIFLLRDPIARAWSQARHNYRFREANFAGCHDDFGAIAERQWIANFAHDWPLVSGDYLGQLQRWLSVFPREQLFLGFYEAIVRDPAGLLRDVFRFLGVNSAVDLVGFPVTERILPGLPGALTPALECSLQALLGDRTRELARYLREEFGLEPPLEWSNALTASTCPALPFRRDLDDGQLAGVLAQEEAFPSAFSPVLEDYRGYRLLFHRGRLFAVDHALGPFHPEEADNAEIQRYLDDHRCFLASSLTELKEQVDQHVFMQGRARQQTLKEVQQELRDAREQITRLEHGLQQTVAALHKLEDDVMRRPEWLRRMRRTLDGAWRRLRKNTHALPLADR